MKRFLLTAITVSAAALGGVWLAATATAAPSQSPVVTEIPWPESGTPLPEKGIPANEPPSTAGPPVDAPRAGTPPADAEPMTATDLQRTDSAGFLTRNGLRGLALTVVPLHQFPAFDAVITRESGWNVFAVNPTSGAYGLGQALPAAKMFTHGWDWAFNPLTQIRWTYDYMVARYGGPDQAWAFWQRNHWY
ncbi:hypothetical protein [Nocardia arizonensis]|uniref:aggregation-promoting factor C-terminal-like domain-containing protein n=1 Tax=Nocardia arizonensis TaxID=1141647 RepID=UPI000AACF564|nr:hypothetical protein [Nocardia arizonensis]